MKGHTLPGINQRQSPLKHPIMDSMGVRPRDTRKHYAEVKHDPKTNRHVTEEPKKEVTPKETSPVKRVKVKPKEGTRDWKTIYNKAKKSGDASEETLASLRKKAVTQHSAKEYVESNPNAELVKPYAEGSKTKTKT